MGWHNWKGKTSDDLSIKETWAAVQLCISDGPTEVAHVSAGQDTGEMAGAIWMRKKSFLGTVYKLVSNLDKGVFALNYLNFFLSWKEKLALARWLSWLEHHPIHQKVVGSIPDWEAADQYFSLISLSLSLSLSNQ